MNKFRNFWENHKGKIIIGGVTMVRDILNGIGGISAGVYNKHISEDLSSAMHKADLLMYVAKNKKKLNSVYGKSNF